MSRAPIPLNALVWPSMAAPLVAISIDRRKCGSQLIGGCRQRSPREGSRVFHWEPVGGITVVRAPRSWTRAPAHHPDGDGELRRLAPAGSAGCEGCRARRDQRADQGDPMPNGAEFVKPGEE